MLAPLWQRLRAAQRRQPALVAVSFVILGGCAWLAPFPTTFAMLALAPSVLRGRPSESYVIAGATVLVLALLPLAGSAWQECLLGALALIITLSLPGPTAVLPPITVTARPTPSRARRWLLSAGLSAVAAAQLDPSLALAVVLVALVQACGDPLRSVPAVLMIAAVAQKCPTDQPLAAAVLGCGTLALAAWRPGQSWLCVAFLTVASSGAALLISPHLALATLAAALVGVLTWQLIPASQTLPAWCQLAPTWRWYVLGKLACDPIAAQLRASPGRWGRVLDLGCGLGLGALVAARRSDVIAYTGIDLDRRKLDVAAALIAHLPTLPEGHHLHEARLPEASAAPADTILAIDLLHYWPPEQQHVLLRWMAAHLCPDGQILLRDGVTDDPASHRIVAGELFTTLIGLNPPSSLYFASAQEWEERFAAAGLEVAERLTSAGGNRLWRLVAKDLTAKVAVENPTCQ